MANSIIIIAVFIGIVFYAYISSSKYNRRARIRRWEKKRKEMELQASLEKTALNTTSLYEEATSNKKIQKSHKWELHESI